MNKQFSEFESGSALYGDDFSDEEIRLWFEDEKEGYADLGAKNSDTYVYAYHQLNQYHGFRYLPKSTFRNVLGFGSAYGDEFLLIKNAISQLTILDPSSAFAHVRNVHGIDCHYEQPAASGDLSFDSNSLDLIVCFGVLHHIPNVSHVLKECYRCLNKGGMMLIREPVISMGDWTKPRPGLTKRERGIPLPIFEQIITDAGFTIIKETPCMFPLTEKIAKKIGILAYNSRFFTVMDKWISALLTWNLHYHARNSFQKLRPTSAFFVLTKN